MFKRYLLHEQLLVRFGALLAVVLASLLGAWVVSYLLLPEGFLRGRSAAQALAGTDLAGGSVWLEWLRLLVINVGVVGVSIIAPNLFRTANNYPLGYVSTTLIAMVFGVTLGTDSFAVSLGGKMLPTLAILGSSGLYEIAAYVLAATATVSIARYRLVGTWGSSLTSLTTTAATRERVLGLALAGVVLALACGWEAFRFAQALQAA